MFNLSLSSQKTIQPGRIKRMRVTVGYPGPYRFADAEDLALLERGGDDILWGLNVLEAVIHPAFIYYRNACRLQLLCLHANKLDS